MERSAVTGSIWGGELGRVATQAENGVPLCGELAAQFGAYVAATGNEDSHWEAPCGSCKQFGRPVIWAAREKRFGLSRFSPGIPS